MNTTLEDNDGEAHRRDPSVGSYTYSIGIFFAALIILAAITYSYYYILGRLKTNNSRRNTPSIHSHNRRRSNRSPISVTSSDYDSESEITSIGLDEATINRYPMMSYSEVNSHKIDRCSGSGCSICLQDYEGKDYVRLLPECGHLFHVNCVDAWLKIHPNCPNCRNPLIQIPVENPPAAPIATIISM